MARRSRMSILKRQRELKKSEKAARKRARRHGRSEGGPPLEPRPTIRLVPGGGFVDDRDADTDDDMDEDMDDVEAGDDTDDQA